MGEDLSPVAPNGLGSSQVAAGGRSVALLCKGAGGPMVCLTYPSAKAWEASRHVPQRCLSESLVHLGQGASCKAPPMPALLMDLPAKGATEQQQTAALQCHPSLFLFSMRPFQNFKRPTFCLRDMWSLGCMSLEQAAAIPSSHLSFKVVRYKCRGPRFCPANLHACNASEQSSHNRIRAALR